MSDLNAITEYVHIGDIRPGDTVMHNGCLRTVCRSDIRRSVFMGTTLFGDSYRLGTLPVVKATPNRAMPSRDPLISLEGGAA